VEPAAAGVEGLAAEPLPGEPAAGPAVPEPGSPAASPEPAPLSAEASGAPAAGLPSVNPESAGAGAAELSVPTSAFWPQAARRRAMVITAARAAICDERRVMSSPW
jgi:hypothetical protein